MSEWRESAIGELPLKIGDGNYSSKYPTAKEFVNLGVPFISNKDIKNGKINSATLRFISPEKHSELKKGHLKTNDILVSTRANIGDIALVDAAFEDANINAQLVFLRCDEKVIHSKFLYHLLSSKLYHDIFQNHASGSAQMQLPLAALREISIIYPEINEQKAIASVLSSLDDKIDLLHRQNTTLERMAETLFRQWFVEEAQEDWKEVTLGDFVEINKKSINKAYPFNNIEYLDTGSLTEGKVESLQSYAIKEAPSRALRLVEHNDVLISTVRPNQKHYGIINNPIDNLVVSSGFCVLTCTKISPHFVYLLLTNDEMTELLHSIAEGSTSTYPSLKPSDIAAITFQMPPNEKLVDFGKIANDSWDKIHQNYKQIQILEKLRDNLLPKLMSGEVRVTSN